jgi:hypothetical protein
MYKNCRIWFDFGNPHRSQYAVKVMQQSAKTLSIVTLMDEAKINAFSFM